MPPCRRHRLRPSAGRSVTLARWAGALLSAVIVTFVAVGAGLAQDAGGEAEPPAPSAASSASDAEVSAQGVEAPSLPSVPSQAATPGTAGPGAATSGPVSPSRPSAAATPRATTGRGGSRSRASGLPWSSGVFSHDATRTANFATTRGRPVDVLAVFPTRDSWDELMSDWWMSPSAVPEGFTGTLAVGLPLFPDDSSMQAAAGGADDARWRAMGRLIASRYPDAWVRVGWEMNIPNWPWAANASNVEQYKQAFRHAATGLRAGGPDLRIVFNPNEGTGSLPDARDAYPGDEYVDDIGLDAYDWDPAYTDEGWEKHRTEAGGWDFWADFARSHGKTFSVPEWGVIPGSDTSGGDNPGYVTKVMTWMGQHADLMSFDAYFEETEEYCRCALSLNPAAQRAYTAMTADLASAGPAGTGHGASATPIPTAAAPSPRSPDASPSVTAPSVAGSAPPDPPAGPDVRILVVPRPAAASIG